MAGMVASAASGRDTSSAVTLDPYQCIAKRNRKYASECTEVHLANLGAEAMSEDFEHFESLEVVWFSGNRLSRVEHLDHNFRIREVYVQDNRLVSLSGLRTFKFLRVLLASNNQLRNLEKQLAVLTKFAFLKKLDLFDNPIAEEPDYRLRIVYHVPQVEILDRRAVKGPERLKADDVVPNLDKVLAAKAEKPRRKAPWAEHSVLERSCFRTATEIRARRRREEDAALGQSLVSRGLDLAAPPPEARVVRENRARWRSTGSIAFEDGMGLHSQAAEVLAVCADAVLRPKPFALTLQRHLADGGAAAKTRGDVFAQTLLLPRRAADEATGRQGLKVSHEVRLTTLGGVR